MRIGRNEPCPCGSGKKYKKCCLGKADDVYYSNPLNLLETYKKVRKESRIKRCLHPKSDECSEKIIGAHSIQNNKIIKRLSSNGIAHEDAIRELVKREQERDLHNMADYFDGSESAKTKLISAVWDVQEVGGELYGDPHRSSEAFSPTEAGMDRRTDRSGGGRLWRRPGTAEIKTDDGDIYVSSGTAR